jgi:outer membrane protein OmpA-like peptidoglycan-associated protein
MITLSFGQITKDSIINEKKIEIKSNNTWAIGAGFSNFIMHGDLRSIGTGNLGNFWNFGGYIYVDKMFNPILGLEFKINYNNISGGAQYFSNIYDVLYIKNTKITNSLFFEGRAYGAELNLILSFSNLYKRQAKKWHLTGYFGGGYHQYNSALFEKNTNGTKTKLVDFGFNPARNSVNEASSIYLSTQLGIKYKLSKRIDIELRPSWYFNYEDHLDATISNKQDWETFFVTHVGLVFKLGKQKSYTIWGSDEVKKPVFDFTDSDGDGVLDKLDVEPNTPVGAMVYGNGTAVDSDKDGVIDFKDKCPLEYGPVSNQGCPLVLDSDGDGIIDKEDKCPKTPGVIENNGCPKQQTDSITKKIALLVTNVYFDTNSDIIKDVSLNDLDEIADLMKKIPNVKFIIEGHTDNTNSDSYNLQLSKRRAASVKMFLVSNGIKEDRLKSIGYGESRPKHSNETSSGRQLNRRVEIKPVKSID